MHIIKNNRPEFDNVQFSCDTCLNKKLNVYPLIRDHLNKFHTTALIGGMGSGKTSLLINIIRKLYRKTFHKIYVFMPSYSRHSLKDDIFEQLPPEQVFDELTEEHINTVYESCQELSSDNKNTLIIYDDVQKSLKDNVILGKLKNLIANQRHLRICNIILLQNWFALAPPIREIMNNAIIFKLGKIQQQKIFDSLIELHKDKFKEITDMIYDKPHQWMFLNIASQRIYKGWDEIVFSDKDESKDDKLEK
jgi:hypothetical protein